MSDKKGCEHCLGPDGECCYPYYGLAPHKHDLTKTGSMIGSTVFTDEPPPDNFVKDSEDPTGQTGVYAYCPECGYSG